MTSTATPSLSAQLAEAADAIRAALLAIDTAKSATARREANEDLDWWIGKRAALGVPVR